GVWAHAAVKILRAMDEHLARCFQSCKHWQPNHTTYSPPVVTRPVDGIGSALYYSPKRDNPYTVRFIMDSSCGVSPLPDRAIRCHNRIYTRAPHPRLPFASTIRSIPSKGFTSITDYRYRWGGSGIASV